MLETPIILFVFNRPDHTRRTLNSLVKNPEAEQCELIVYSDGPRTPSDLEKIKQTRAFIEGIQGFKSVKLIKRDENWGLAKSIIHGVSENLRDYPSVIVMEDDLEVSPYFLQYMMDGLRVYQDEEKVASIHGYCLPIKQKLPETFFLRGADCWGWATWARAWSQFEANGQKLLDEITSKKLIKAFDMGGAVPHTQMLRDQIQGKNNSWAIRWHASTFLKEMVTLYPGVSLVNNIGNDGSGQHCEVTRLYQSYLSKNPIKVHKQDAIENDEARRQHALFHRRGRPTFLKRAFGYLSRIRKKYCVEPA